MDIEPLPEYLKNIYAKTGVASFHAEQTALLYTLSKRAGERGGVVEVGGNANGVSSLALAAGQKVRGGAKIYSIEPASSAEYARVIAEAGLADWVDRIVQPYHVAAAAWGKPIELLFIDGNHSYFAVKKDIRLWTKHVVEEGMVLVHDYGQDAYEATSVAVRKFLLADTARWRVISDREFGSMLILQRRPETRDGRSRLTRLRHKLVLGETVAYLKSRLFG